jgi:hypothetical protein
LADFSELLGQIKQAGESSHEQNKAVIEDHLAAGAVIVSQQAAALAAGVLSRPDFFRESVN